MSKTTSASGRAALKLHEGDVLKAYRCPAGRWTIGSGLTKASGVVDPKPGMVITAAESDRLLSLALERNYEPAVLAEMVGAEQHEFDAGVSFHFNTGAISRASWVKKWRAGGDWAGVKSRLFAWNKGGGKVLPGLVRRRSDEYNILRYALYPVAPHATPSGAAQIVVSLDSITLKEIRTALKRFGYDPGENRRGIAKSAITAFQADHDLTVDGVVGVATLSTLQRMIDARSRVAGPAASVAAAGTSVTAPLTEEMSQELSGVPYLDWIMFALLALAVAWAAWRAWQYRDAIAAKAQRRFPNLATKLRSI